MLVVLGGLNEMVDQMAVRKVIAVVTWCSLQTADTGSKSLPVHLYPPGIGKNIAT